MAHERTHRQWLKWLGNMDKYLKYDVCLYEMTYVNEQTLKHPRLYPEQECLGGELDMLFTHIYEYDGGIIGAGGHYKIIENIEFGDGIDVGDEGDLDDFNEEKECEMMTHIRSTLARSGNIRIGFYSKRNDDVPSFYLISTNHNENPDYFAKQDLCLYDSDSCSLYYQIRYGISNEMFYILSGMTEWDSDAFDTFDGEHEMTVCPNEIDVIEEHRFAREYMKGADLDELLSQIQALPSTDDDTLFEFASKSNLYIHIVKLIRDNAL